VGRVEEWGPLALAADQVGAFITVDQNIQHQQRLPVSGLAIIIIRAESNDIDVLRPLMEGFVRCSSTSRAATSES
jgi:hypothetical protein